MRLTFESVNWVEQTAFPNVNGVCAKLLKTE